MSYRLRWMPSALHEYGLRVRLVDGWELRGHGDVADIRTVVAHHTAGPAEGNYPSLNTVIHGRSDLPGPLANLGLARDATVLVIAAGRAWHAGAVRDEDYANLHSIGIEAESTGHGDWTEAQLAAYPVLCAALLDYLGEESAHALAHAEVCDPPGRKIDAAGWPGGMPGMRKAIAAAIRAHHKPKRPAPQIPAPGTTLREGMGTLADPDPRVVWLQGQLNADLQHPPGIPVTGRFGPATRHAVWRFQCEHPHLLGYAHNPKLAGLAGPRTIETLKEYSD